MITFLFKIFTYFFQRVNFLIPGLKHSGFVENEVTKCGFELIIVFKIFTFKEVFRISENMEICKQGRSGRTKS